MSLDLNVNRMCKVNLFVVLRSVGHTRFGCNVFVCEFAMFDFFAVSNVLDIYRVSFRINRFARTKGAHGGYVIDFLSV